jgi:small subunit ribosomal protein S20
MPNTKSAIRRVSKTQKQTFKNRLRKSKYKSVIKKMQEYIDAGKTNEAKKFLPKFYSQLMKVAKTGVINKKTASRKISRLTKKINNFRKKNSQLKVD